MTVIALVLDVNREGEAAAIHLKANLSSRANKVSVVIHFKSNLPTLWIASLRLQRPSSESKTVIAKEQSDRGDPFESKPVIAKEQSD